MTTDTLARDALKLSLVLAAIAFVAAAIVASL